MSASTESFTWAAGRASLDDILSLGSGTVR